MDTVKMEELRTRLINEQADIQRRVNAMQETMGVALEDSVGELSTYDNHPADIGSETFERSKDFALREDALLRLTAIADALRSMETGTYGFCDECGNEIDPARLEALPFTTKCVDCKARGEQGEERVRPLEEASLPRPFAYPGDESIIYDREDTWQDLAQHGLSTEIEPLEEEDRGQTEDVDAIPYVEEDGMFFQDTQVRGDTGGH